jgi:hypothetical protein
MNLWQVLKTWLCGSQPKGGTALLSNRPGRATRRQIRGNAVGTTETGPRKHRDGRTSPIVAKRGQPRCQDTDVVEDQKPGLTARPRDDRNSLEAGGVAQA